MSIIIPGPSRMEDFNTQNSAVCLGCGCTEMAACDTPAGPCHWLVMNEAQTLGVCSDCEFFLPILGIIEERLKQLVDHGFTPAHDDQYTNEELALAAAHYAAPSGIFRMKHGDPDADPIDVALVPAWPDSWMKEWDHKDRDGRIKDLERAGALIAAEIGRLLRLEAAQNEALIREMPNGTY